MIEIKFRAWDSKNKKMYSFELIELPYSENVNLDGQFDGLLDMYYKLMQYTGLKDKNGVEIYCGDILKTTYYGTKKVQDTIMECAIMGLYSVDTSKIEVIGNIYENSNLLGDNIEQN